MLLNGVFYRELETAFKSPGHFSSCRLMGVSRSGFYAWLRCQDREPDPDQFERNGQLAIVAYRARQKYPDIPHAVVNYSNELSGQ